MESVENVGTKTLRAKVWCQAWYMTHIEVPADMTLTDAIKYTQDHILETEIEDGLEYIAESDEVDEENCYFV